MVTFTWVPGPPEQRGTGPPHVGGEPEDGELGLRDVARITRALLEEELLIVHDSRRAASGEGFAVDWHERFPQVFLVHGRGLRMHDPLAGGPLHHQRAGGERGDRVGRTPSGWPVCGTVALRDWTGEGEYAYSRRAGRRTHPPCRHVFIGCSYARPDRAQLPATDPDAPEPRASSRALGGLGCGGAAFVGVFLLVGMLAWSAWASKNFPRVAPEEMADRALQRSQEAYTVMGFTRTIEPGLEKLGVSTRNTLSSSSCYDSGLLGLKDETIDGAYSMSHSWALDHVPASQAVPGLAASTASSATRAGRSPPTAKASGAGCGTCSSSGTTATSGCPSPGTRSASTCTGGATMPCAYDPEWKKGDVSPAGDDQRPPGSIRPQPWRLGAATAATSSSSVQPPSQPS